MELSEMKEVFAHEQREAGTINGDFSLFVAWRQMKAMESAAESLAKLANPPLVYDAVRDRAVPLWPTNWPTGDIPRTSGG